MPGVPSSGPLWFDFFRGTLTYLGEGVRQRGSYFLATWPEERHLMSNWFIYSLATSPLHRIASQGRVLLGPELCEVLLGCTGLLIAGILSVGPRVGPPRLCCLLPLLRHCSTFQDLFLSFLSHSPCVCRFMPI